MFDGPSTIFFHFITRTSLTCLTLLIEDLKVMTSVHELKIANVVWGAVSSWGGGGGRCLLVFVAVVVAFPS